MNPIKIVMKEKYTEKQYEIDVKLFEREGSFLGSEKKDGHIIFIIDKNKSKILSNMERKQEK